MNVAHPGSAFQEDFSCRTAVEYMNYSLASTSQSILMMVVPVNRWLPLASDECGATTDAVPSCRPTQKGRCQEAALYDQVSASKYLLQKQNWIGCNVSKPQPQSHTLMLLGKQEKIWVVYTPALGHRSQSPLRIWGSWTSLYTTSALSQVGPQMVEVSMTDSSGPQAGSRGERITLYSGFWPSAQRNKKSSSEQG